MKKQIKYFFLLPILLIINTNCSFENNDSELVKSTKYQNTLKNDNLGDKTGLVQDYFYNFENNVEANFFRYSPSLMANYESYSDYYSLFNEDPTTMVYKTFPDYLVSMKPEDASQYTQRTYIDSLSSAGRVSSDSVQISSTPFKNLEGLEWNLDAEPSLQRYKLSNSDWVTDDTIINYDDIYDVSAYWAVVDTPFIQEGLLFIDSSEWKDTNYVFLADNQIMFENSFEFTKKQLSSDSLVFRINTDCNDNNAYDEAESGIQDYNGDNDFQDVLFEYLDNNNNGIYDAGDDPIEDYNSDNVYSVVYEFVDRGNQIWDPDEPYYDIDSSGTYDLNEPFQDRNCNGKWDGEESYVDSDGSQTYSVGEVFIDKGNEMYDDSELFYGGDPSKLFSVGDKPNSLLANWSDQFTPQVVLNIVPGDDLTDRWGTVYENIIEEVEIVDLQRQYVDDIDSLITLFTRKEVGHIVEENENGSFEPQDYYITKSEWSKVSGGQTERFYNYHIFHQPNHLKQVSHPSYFLPVGFYFSPNDIENGFWFKNKLESKVLYYTKDGQLRAGESIDTSYYDTTDVAIYFIEKSYRVESDSNVVVPAGHRPDMSVSAKDTTFTDCFKISQTTTMTMLGSGVEFGQRTDSWLAKNIGLVKSEVFIRWTEHPYDADYTANNNYLDTLNQAWIGFNRLELSSVEIQESNNVFRKIVQPVKNVRLKNIAEEQSFNFDPFYISKQYGIHTIDLRELIE